MKFSNYRYSEWKDEVFKEENQMMFIKIREHIKQLHKVAGVCTMEKAIDANVTGDSFAMLACVSRLEEIREIFICPNPIGSSYNGRLVYPG
jgi:hypothetical protein